MICCVFIPPAEIPFSKKMFRLFLCWLPCCLLTSRVYSLNLAIGIVDGGLVVDNITYTVSGANCDSLHITSQTEECKYYGECCGDVVRVRERLEPGTFQCMDVGLTTGKENILLFNFSKLLKFVKLSYKFIKHVQM